MTTTLEGTRLPTHTLPASERGSITLPDDYAGQWVVLYFYPKDDTPGCTRQACTYRDNAESFAENGAVVLGVSADNLDSHAAFAAKYTLNFPLLVDSDHALARALGVWRDAEYNGLKYTGMQRDTFLIDPSTTMATTFDALVELHAL
jgi:peroxiredoxin Q/BCP